MDVLLPQGLATTVEYYPPVPPVSVTMRVLSPQGVSLAAPSCTVDPLAGTVSAVASTISWTCDPDTGTFASGRFYWWTATTGTESSRFLLGSVRGGDALVVEWPIAAVTPAVGDTIRGARVTAIVPTTATGTRGEDFAIEWTSVDAIGNRFVERVTAHVVRAQARAAVDVGLAKSHMTTAWPGYAEQRPYGYFVSLAERASERLFKRIRRTGRYLQLLWQAGDFAAAGRVAVDYELAVDKLVPGNVLDVATYKESLTAEMDREIEDVISSRGYDEDDSGSIEKTEIDSINAIELERD